jgi:putative ABC transport system permease protein
MLRNYLLIGLRSLQKHRFYSIINISGLAIGLAASLLLVTWIIHESSYDKFHPRARQIHRASLEYSFGGQTAKTSVSPTALLPALQKNFQEVETGVRLYNPSAWSPYVVRQGAKLD